MVNIARIFVGLIAATGIILTVAPAAEAQTYVYPITGYNTYYGYNTGYTYNNYDSTGCVAITNYLSIGSSDYYTAGQVSMLQQYMGRLGYMTGVSGTYDYNTSNAVSRFQSLHGISVTGTVGPQTRAAIQQASCGGYSYGNPTPIYTNNNNYCYGSNSWNRYEYPYSYTYGNYNSYNCGVTLNSASASYSYNLITITLRGYGFNQGTNTIHFNGSTYTASSYDGTTLTFTVPNGYYSGNYDIYVVGSNGLSSNTLTFPMSSSSYYYNNNNNNGYNYSNNVSLSNVSGPTSVRTNTYNTWNVTVNNSAYGYNYNNSQYVTTTVDWGDNTNATSQSSYVSGSQNLSFSHTYSYPGTYTMHVTSTGNNGAYAYQTLVVSTYSY